MFKTIKNLYILKLLKNIFATSFAIFLFNLDSELILANVCFAQESVGKNYNHSLLLKQMNNKDFSINAKDLFPNSQNNQFNTDSRKFQYFTSVEIGEISCDVIMIVWGRDYKLSFRDNPYAYSVNTYTSYIQTPTLIKHIRLEDIQPNISVLKNRCNFSINGTKEIEQDSILLMNKHKKSDLELNILNSWDMIKTQE